MWAPLASGAYRGWALATAFLIVGVAAAAWLLAALAERQLSWRRTPLDLPLALLLALVLLQIVLGNRALVAWALGPAHVVTEVAADFPAPFLTIGSVTPRQTLASGLVFVGYAAVYLLLVQTVRTRRQLGFFVRLLLTVGGVMAFLGLLDYLTGETWLLAWRDHPFTGRLSGTFVNPDHFAAWLTMLILLGPRLARGPHVESAPRAVTGHAADGTRAAGAGGSPLPADDRRDRDGAGGGVHAEPRRAGRPGRGPAVARRAPVRVGPRAAEPGHHRRPC